MELTSEAIRTLEGLIQRANAVTQTIDGVTLCSIPLHEPKLAPAHTADALKLHTLEGVKEVLAASAADEGAPAPYLVHVVSPTRVDVVSEVFGSHRQREQLAQAEPVVKQFAFGAFMDLEAFVIAAQALFVQTLAMSAVLKLVGNIKDQNVNEISDDGVTQGVTARVGIARLDNVQVPNPVSLAPYRTFPEVGQPESKFVLRMQSGVKEKALPAIALFEADGGAWRLQAMKSITEWLRAALPQTRVIG